MIVLHELAFNSKFRQHFFIVAFEKKPLSSRKIRGSRMTIPWIYAEEALTFYPQVSSSTALPFYHHLLKNETPGKVFVRSPGKKDVSF